MMKQITTKVKLENGAVTGTVNSFAQISSDILAEV